MNKKAKTLKVLDIVSFIGVFVFFILALICALFKISGTKFGLFGNRYDVVLTDSMSEKNELHKDFLEKYNDQINAFDLVKSKKINSPEDLAVGDIVVYNDRDIGTNMHRIVNIDKSAKDTLTFYDSTKSSIGEFNGVILNNQGSYFGTDDIQFYNLEIKLFSLTGETNNFNFNIQQSNVTPEISIEDVNGGKLITYKVTRTSRSPAKINVSHNKIYDFSKEMILSIKLDSFLGNIECNPFDLNEEDGNLTKNYNLNYKFETRGDKSKTSDGWYSFVEIESKVVKSYAKVGYVVRFFASTWGGIMFISLGVLFLTFDIVASKMDKKEKALVYEKTSEKKAKQTKNKIK